MNDGWIKYFRKIEDWSFYKDYKTKHLFEHCLIKANTSEKEWNGVTIPRGSFITSTKHLSEETGLTVKEVRNCLEKLKHAQNVASKGTNKYTLISVVNYEVYQDKHSKKGKQTGKQRANKGQQHKNNKNKKKNNIIINNNIIGQFYENEKLNNTFKTFLTMRDNLNVPNSEEAIKIIKDKMSKYSDEDKQVMLENAISNGWKNVYPVKKENKFNNYTNSKEFTQEESKNMNELKNKYLKGE